MEIDLSKEYYTLSSPNVALEITKTNNFGNIVLYLINNTWHNAESLSETPINVIDPNKYKVQKGNVFSFTFKSEIGAKYKMRGEITEIETDNASDDLIITVKLENAGTLKLTYPEFVKLYPNKIEVEKEPEKEVKKGIDLSESIARENIESTIEPVLLINGGVNQPLLILKRIGVVGTIGFNKNRPYFKTKRGNIVNNGETIYVVYDNRYNNYYYFEYCTNNKFELIGYKFSWKRKAFPQELIGCEVFELSKTQYFSLIKHDQVSLATDFNESNKLFYSIKGKAIITHIQNDFVFAKLTIPFNHGDKYFYGNQPLKLITYDTENKLVKLNKFDMCLNIGDTLSII